MKHLRKWNVVLLVLALSVLVLPAQKSEGSGQAYWYNVYTDCEECLLPIPSMCGALTGQWHVDCDGNWTGWGSMPDDPCTYYTSGLAEACP